MLKQLVMLAFILAGFSAHANIVVGTVDVQEVLLAIKQGKAIRNKLKKNFEKKKKSLVPMQKNFQKLEGDYQKKRTVWNCLLYTSPSPRDATLSRMPSSA